MQQKFHSKSTAWIWDWVCVIFQMSIAQTVKVSKFQKQFFLKLHCPKSDRNFLKDFCPSLKRKTLYYIKYSPISIHNNMCYFLTASACNAVLFLFDPFQRLAQKSFKNWFFSGQWSFKKSCFWDLLTFIVWAILIWKITQTQSQF